MYVLVVAIGIGAGLLLRPLLQTTSTATPNVRCAGPTGSELALSETLTSSFAGQTQNVSRTYLLERPAQVPLQFDGGNDADSTPITCSQVSFGPGARLLFARSTEVQVVEFIGPTVKRFLFANDKTFSSYALNPKFKLGLKLEEYTPNGAPTLDEAGKNGRLELKRLKLDSSFPNRLLFSTSNGGATWSLQK